MAEDARRGTARAFQADRRSDPIGALLAALAYLLVVLWTFRAVLPVLDSTLPELARMSGPEGQLGRWDLSMVVSVVTHHAHALLTHPTRLFADGQCYPMSAAHTLGEHMLGTSLLAVLPYLVTHEPLTTYNVVLILSVWIPAIAMYLFSREFVRSSAAAFVAGLLFALVPARLGDFAHPFVHGDLWTPLALLFLHRTVTLRGWRNVVGLTTFATLVLLESLYAVIASAILISCFAISLAWRNPRACVRAAPHLLTTTALVLGVAWAVFTPYLQTRSTWNILAGQVGVPMPVNALPIAQAAFVLAAIGIADRLRGPREGGSDPRVSLVVGGVLVYWCAVSVITVPVLNLALVSPLVLLRNVVPGLDAVRATGAIGSATGLVLSFLAGYAVVALTEKRRVGARVAIVSLLTLYVLAERNYQPLTRLVFGNDFAIGTWHARPSDDDLRLLRATDGPILRLPFPTNGLKSLDLADDLRLVSFDPRPTSACYNSFGSPLSAQLGMLAEALPDRAAAEALEALGFRTVILVLDDYWPPDLELFEHRLTARRWNPPLVPQGRTGRLAAYRVVTHSQFGTDLRSLVVLREQPVARSVVPRGHATLSFTIVNHGRRTFRQPDPIAPSDVLVRWRSDDGRGEEQRARVLLPIALAAGARYQLPIDVQTPATAGHYLAELALAAQPDATIATLDVDVSPATEQAASADAAGAS